MDVMRWHGLSQPPFPSSAHCYHHPSADNQETGTLYRVHGVNCLRLASQARRRACQVPTDCGRQAAGRRRAAGSGLSHSHTHIFCFPMRSLLTALTPSSARPIAVRMVYPSAASGAQAPQTSKTDMTTRGSLIGSRTAKHGQAATHMITHLSFFGLHPIALNHGCR